MLTKAGVIDLLNQGGHVYMDDVRNRAHVYNASDERLDSCRYDTAEKLLALDEYEAVSLGAWSHARRIENPEARRAVKEAAAAELRSIRTPGTILLRAKNDCRIGENFVAKGRTYCVEVYGDGTQEQPRNAYGTLYDVRTHEHAVYFEIVSRPEAAQVEEPADDLRHMGVWDEEPAQPVKRYARADFTAGTNSAREALAWHRAGHDIIAVTRGAGSVYVHGAPQEAPRSREDENRAHCRHIAQEAEAYAGGEVYRCPDCGEVLRLPDDVGDKYRCPGCGTVSDVDDLEQLSMWDFLTDVYDVEYRVSSDKEYRSVRVMVACGGPNIYIDTASAMVKLYWWTEYAEFPLSYDARDAIDEWAEEYWNI